MLKGLCRVRNVPQSIHARSSRAGALCCQQQGADVRLTSAFGVCVVKVRDGIRSVDISRRSPVLAQERGKGKHRNAPGPESGPAPRAGLLRAHKAEVPWCVPMVAPGGRDEPLQHSPSLSPVSWAGWRVALGAAHSRTGAKAAPLGAELLLLGHVWARHREHSGVGGSLSSGRRGRWVSVQGWWPPGRVTGGCPCCPR